MVYFVTCTVYIYIYMKYNCIDSAGEVLNIKVFILSAYFQMVLTNERTVEMMSKHWSGHH